MNKRHDYRTEFKCMTEGQLQKSLEYYQNQWDEYFIKGADLDMLNKFQKKIDYIKEKLTKIEAVAYPESEERQLKVGDEVILVAPYFIRYKIQKIVRVTKTLAITESDIRFKNNPLKRYGIIGSDSPNGVTYFKEHGGFDWHEAFFDTPYMRGRMLAYTEKREVEKFINILQSERFDMEKKRKIYHALKDLELWAD